MATQKPNRLIHFISDFLRDEKLRCWVMEDEDEAYIEHALSSQQQAILREVRDGTIDRLQLLAAISKEIEAIRFEAGAGEVLQYPSGEVRIHKHNVFSSGNDRIIRVVGIGFVADATITFDGVPIPKTSFTRRCDEDVWQRLTIDVSLRPGTYTMRIDRGQSIYAEVDVVCP
ncbi:MAG: hypothetical protein KIT14_16085 [bacterium]|nr:hypothetical protein [bacterium]